MKTFWIISALWLVGCIWAIWWVLPRLDAADKELLHAEAIHDDQEWERERRKGWRYPSVAAYTVNPFQARAREAEGADDFRDDDTPRVA